MAMQGQSPHSKMTGPVVLESAIPARLTGRHAGQLLTPKTRKRLRYDKGAYTPSISAVKGGEIMYHLGGRALRCGV